ncbi:hypothetical protein [Proteocatella sphenisci]|uniref:hypothetical protein n=1 Tax=Proteocatella sphenisci TaxID=181070 RepID=UPI00048D3206|nr:hypothetical protein [Proteocatella sphenisci]
MILARKKVVLFIVEGFSEKESLELLLSELFGNNSQVIFEVAQGDITSDKHSSQNNIKSKITELIKSSGRKFKPADYKEVIHLVDMDAAFVSEDSIHSDTLNNVFSYRNDGIYAPDIQSVKDRNKRKQALLKLLSQTSKVYNSVPYRVFYFSCNLEHVLHNEIEVEDYAKVQYAENFQDLYIDDLEGFIDFICNSDFSVKLDYANSWNFIQENNNSIKRFTNFNIVLKDYSLKR